MKTLLEKWAPAEAYSFNIKKFYVSRNLGEPQDIFMRMHNEYEITVILGGSGKRFIGNTIQNFSIQDVFLIGPQVQHFVQLDEGQEMHGVTIHFLKNSFGDGFFDLPENYQINRLLDDSVFGIYFENFDASNFYGQLLECMKLNPFERMIKLFELLQILSLFEHRKLLSSHGFTKVSKKKEFELINKTYDYILSRFENQNITLKDISSHVNMSPATFCRFFKKHFHKTFTSFMNEVRVGHACKKLRETNHGISEIAYASGYNHLTHFNKQFKRIMGYCPKEYRRELE